MKCESYTFEGITKAYVYNRILVSEKVIIENNIKKFSSKNIISNGYIKEYSGSTLILTKKIINSEKKMNDIKDSKGILVEYKNNYIKVMEF